MNKNSIKILKLVLTSIFFITFLSSCSDITKNIASSSPSNHKNFTGSNNFHSLINDVVKKQESRVKKYLLNEEVVLVSDFVNLDKLKNRSKLGFLLSEHLKNALSNRSIIVREVELAQDFQYGKTGFNLLTRQQEDIKKKYVDTKYAFVGTYSITTESLIVFMKLIDITNGNILSSASSETLVDKEILELETEPRTPYIRTPLVL